MEKLEFYSRGKLLLTGEYVVLDGAKALALPTKKGQSLTVETNGSGLLHWKSYDCYHKIWFQTEIKTASLFEEKAPIGNSKFDKTLFKILWEAIQLNPAFIDPKIGYIIETHLEFERLWGLGTSSTLINNIAQWAKINAYELLHKSFGGSGYDIAAANANTPIFYQHTKIKTRPLVEKVASFNPLFLDKLFFIYLENKKDSKDAIRNYKSISHSNINNAITQISTITSKISITNNLHSFEALINEHENLIASILKCKTIKQEKFKDFPGAIKSLGGWGGDFILATGNSSAMNYFLDKNYKTIVPYNEMIFRQNNH